MPHANPPPEDLSAVLIGASVGRRMAQLLGAKPGSKRHAALVNAACVATKDVLGVVNRSADPLDALVTFLNLEDAVAL